MLSFTRRHFYVPLGVIVCHGNFLKGDEQSWQAFRQGKWNEWNIFHYREFNYWWKEVSLTTYAGLWIAWDVKQSTSLCLRDFQCKKQVPRAQLYNYIPQLPVGHKYSDGMFMASYHHDYMAVASGTMVCSFKKEIPCLVLTSFSMSSGNHFT